MGRNRKKAAGPDTPMRQKMEKQLELDVIMREAAAIVLSDIRKMKDAQVKDDGGKKISATELPNLVNLQDVARKFRARLENVGSNVDALGQRLQKWRIRGVDDDPVTLRGRPRTAVPSPLSCRVVAVVAERSKGHLGKQAALAVAEDRMDLPDKLKQEAVSKKEQLTIFRKLRQEAGVIKGVAKPMTPVLLHATTCESILGKFHLNMQAAYRREPLFAKEPIRIANTDEGNKADRAGRDGRIASAVTTVNRIKQKGYKMLRPMSLNDSSEGPSSSCNWILASGDLLAKTPIAKAPPGYVIPDDFFAPAEFYAPATHGCEPYLPGMHKQYFDTTDAKCNSRVYCTQSGRNNTACFAHMFMFTAYPIWRRLVPDGPLLLIYDSCNAHNWTEELADFCGKNHVHIVKLFHNTTTRTQPLDCGFNLCWRNIVHSAQDNLIAAGIFKHAHLNRNMKCKSPKAANHRAHTTRSKFITARVVRVHCNKQGFFGGVQRFFGVVAATVSGEASDGDSAV
jgi:hypothetical protein